MCHIKRKLLYANSRIHAAIAAVTAIALAAPHATPAQSPANTATSTSTNTSARGRFETRSFNGALIPTGEQRDVLGDAYLTGGQLAYHVHRNVTVVGTLAWSPATDRTTWSSAGTVYREQDLNVFQYDLGVEGRLPELFAAGSWAVSPFGALGAGARTYDYRGVDGVDAETNFVGYVGAGADVGPRGARWALRLGARDYVSAFRGLRGELTEREARNDVALTAGLTFNFGGR